MTFNIDGISLLERGEKPDEGLAKELGELSTPATLPASRSFRSPPPATLAFSRRWHRLLTMPCATPMLKRRFIWNGARVVFDALSLQTSSLLLLFFLIFFECPNVVTPTHVLRNPPPRCLLGPNPNCSPSSMFFLKALHPIFDVARRKRCLRRGVQRGNEGVGQHGDEAHEGARGVGIAEAGRHGGVRGSLPVLPLVFPGVFL